MLELDFERQSESEIKDSEDINWAYILDPHAPDSSSSSANTGMDVDVSDTEGEPAIDANRWGDSTLEVNHLGKLNLLSVHSVLDLLLAVDQPVRWGNGSTCRAPHQKSLHRG
jgi:hypothetical protein